MSKKTLKYGDVVVNKKEFHASKQAMALNLVGTDKAVICDKIRHNDNDFDDDIIRSLCIILLPMSGYIKYFDDGGKNMSFKIEDESAFLKYNDEKYIKTVYHT